VLLTILPLPSAMVLRDHADGLKLSARFFGGAMSDDGRFSIFDACAWRVVDHPLRADKPTALLLLVTPFMARRRRGRSPIRQHLAGHLLWLLCMGLMHRPASPGR
jgi:hypothetical protein